MSHRVDGHGHERVDNVDQREEEGGERPSPNINGRVKCHRGLVDDEEWLR